MLKPSTHNEIKCILNSPPKQKEVCAMKKFNIQSWVEGLSISDIEELQNMAQTYTSAKLSILVKPYMKYVQNYQELQDTMKLVISFCQLSE